MSAAMSAGSPPCPRAQVREAQLWLLDAERTYARIKAVYLHTQRQRQAASGRARMAWWHREKFAQVAAAITQCDVERARRAVEAAREGMQ